MGTNAFDLEDKLGKRGRGYYKIDRNQKTTTETAGVIGYLAAQTSKVFAQKSIRSWRETEPFPGFPLKYQLEIDNYDRNNQPKDDIGENYSASNPESGANTQRSTQEHALSQKSEIGEDDSSPDDETTNGKYLRIIMIIWEEKRIIIIFKTKCIISTWVERKSLEYKNVKTGRCRKSK